MKYYILNDSPIKDEYKEKRKITPAMAVKTLKKNGQDITEEQAEKVLELMYFLAELIVKQNPEILNKRPVSVVFSKNSLHHVPQN